MLSESTVVPSTRTEWTMFVIGTTSPQPANLGRSSDCQVRSGFGDVARQDGLSRVHRWARCAEILMDTVYPQLYVPTRPYWTSRDCRKATATNGYPVFGDGSVNCLTHFQKVFRVPELGRQAGNFEDARCRTAFHLVLDDGQEHSEVAPPMRI